MLEIDFGRLTDWANWEIYMSIRFGSVRNIAVHEIFDDDHDVRKDIDLIDGKTFIDDIQKDVRDVVKIMYPSRIQNFHVIESGLYK